MRKKLYKTRKRKKVKKILGNGEESVTESVAERYLELISKIGRAHV